MHIYYIYITSNVLGHIAETKPLNLLETRTPIGKQENKKICLNYTVPSYPGKVALLFSFHFPESCIQELQSGYKITN